MNIEFTVIYYDRESELQKSYFVFELIKDTPTIYVKDYRIRKNVDIQFLEMFYCFAQVFFAFEF